MGKCSEVPRKGNRRTMQLMSLGVAVVSIQACGGLEGPTNRGVLQDGQRVRAYGTTSTVVRVGAVEEKSDVAWAAEGAIKRHSLTAPRISRTVGGPTTQARLSQSQAPATMTADFTDGHLVIGELSHLRGTPNSKTREQLIHNVDNVIIRIASFDADGLPTQELLTLNGKPVTSTRYEYTRTDGAWTLQRSVVTAYHEGTAVLVSTSEIDSVVVSQPSQASAIASAGRMVAEWFLPRELGAQRACGTSEDIAYYHEQCSAERGAYASATIALALSIRELSIGGMASTYYAWKAVRAALLACRDRVASELGCAVQEGIISEFISLTSLQITQDSLYTLCTQEWFEAGVSECNIFLEAVGSRLAPAR